MNTEDLLKRYEKSHFDAFVPVDQVASPAAQLAAMREYQANPVTALIENVDAAKLDIRATQDRAREAQLDGLFEVDGFKAASKQQRKRWVAAIDIVRGDCQRALSELAHWRGYVNWAINEQTAKVALIERRLPPEPDEEAVPF